MQKSRKRIKEARVAKRRSRTGAYLFIALVAILVVGVGWYVYASAQAANAMMYAKINTTKGLIQVELYQGKVPKTVTNFVNLANSGFYTNLVWHRIRPGFVIQTGDPNTKDGGGVRDDWGKGGSPQTVPLEIDSSLHNYAGYLGMARSQSRDSGSSQFYINLVDNSSTLDARLGFDGYAVFGKVTGGMDVVDAIASVQTVPNTEGQPANPVPFVTSITVSSSP